MGSAGLRMQRRNGLTVTRALSYGIPHMR
jgi:hypothetical protein